jgi:hypothetical protein
MKLALSSVLVLTAASRLAQGQQALPRWRDNRGQALPRWRENRGQAAVEDATILFPVAVRASEQSEGTKTARSRIDDTITLLDPRSRAFPPGTRFREFSGQAAVVNPRSRRSPSGSPPGTRPRGSTGQAAVDNARTSTATRSRAADYGVYSFGYDASFYTSGKGKGKGKGGSSKHAKSKGE